jgi:hypothetical protein
MQDIDFDELDRAVASTMSPDDTPAQPMQDSASDSIPVEKKVTPATRRSSGRFMDVVHPSSDMRTASVPARPASPQSDPVPEREPEVQNSTMPDPLDFHGFTMDETPPVAEPASEPTQESDAPAPESPFLTDAKVEKRPLGAFSAAEPAKDETPLLEAPDEERLPATTEEVANDTPEPEVPTAPEVEPETSPVVDDPIPAVEDEPSNVPTSITPQYKEHPSSEAASGPMYDTESYHQALVHAPAKKSGALIVVWIVALIVLGAAGGAVAYFFVLPLL